MNDRWRRVTGAISVVGGALAVIASIPPGWYGVEPTDSYLFDPAVFSPLWIERTVLPLFSLGALGGLLLGVGALVYRDWKATRSLRVGGSLVVVGGATLGVGLYGPEFVTPAGTPVGPVAGLAGIALLVWAGILLLVGGPLLGYFYVRTGHQWFGATVLGVVPVMLLLGYLLPGHIGDFGGSIPVLVLGIVLARDLLFRKPVRSGMGNV